MVASKIKSRSFTNVMRSLATMVLLGSFLSTVSDVRATPYTESIGLGAAATYSVVAGAAISGGAGNVLTGAVLSGAVGTASGPWLAASLASAEAAGRAATTQSSSTVFPVNRTFTAGVYKYTTFLVAEGDVIMDAQNDPNAVFVFQIGGYLSTEAGFHISLINGARAANIYWQVDTYFSPGALSIFKGTVLAGSYITTGAGVILNGKLFALNGAVTIGANNIITNSLSLQTTTWNPSLAVLTSSSPIFLEAATGIGGGSVSYAVQDAGTTGCTVNSVTRNLSYVGAGSCTVTATVAATDSYTAATVTKIFVISDTSPVSTSPLATSPVSTSPLDTSPSSTSLSATSITGVPITTTLNSQGSGNGTTALSALASSRDTMHLADGNLHVFLRGLGVKGKVVLRDKDGGLSLRYGGQLEIRRATGFAPNSLVRVTIMSPQKLLRSFRTDAHGTFSGSVFLPPSSHFGIRMLKLTGNKSTGAARTLWIRARFSSVRGTSITNCHIHITKTIVRAC
jgi:hypothetical protein